MALYQDRSHAGRVLAAALDRYAKRSDVVVLALPRGGVPVGFEVARRLAAPLDVLVVRKLGVPGHEELAMGALASGGARVLNPEVVTELGIPESALVAATAREAQELARRDRTYRGDRPPIDVRGKTVILVDDGLATGSSMRAAIAGLRQRQPARIVVGVPVAAPSTCEALRQEVDEIVCIATPDAMYAVGLWYADFSQTTDEQVRALLAGAERARTAQTEAGISGHR